MKVVKASAGILFLLFLLTVFPTVTGGQEGTLTVDYSTYLGGAGTDQGYGIAVDDSGAAYIGGSTASANFPTVAPFQSLSGGNSDGFISKFSSTGTALVYSSYLGGSADDYGYAIVLGSDGAAYLAGKTSSTDFPTINPYQSAFAGMTDGFVAKFSSTGSDLVYSTYLGGVKGDTVYGMAESGGEVYLAGATGSSDFPTHNPYQASLAGGKDAFLTVLFSSGTGLMYSTFLGGSLPPSPNNDDFANSVAVDSIGTVYLAGYTGSVDFPTRNAYQSFLNQTGATKIDAFVTRFSTDGSVLIFSTYLGGSERDVIKTIKVGPNDPYVVGNTFSTDFPTKNAYMTSKAGIYDIFLAKLYRQGGALLYSTYLGGTGIDYAGGDQKHFGNALYLDSSNRAYITGFTASTDFPIVNPYQASHGEGAGDIFVTLFSSTGSALDFSTYLGGSADDGGRGITVVSPGRIFLTGWSDSGDFPTVNPYQPVIGGGTDAIVAGLKWTTPCTPTPTPSTTPSVTPTPSTTPSVTPTPSTTPSLTPTPGCPECGAPPFYVKVLEDVTIDTPRSDASAGWTYYFRAYVPDLEESRTWGYIRDRENDFTSETNFTRYYQCWINLKPGSDDWNIHTGDLLEIEHDGGQIFTVALPPITGTGSGKLFYLDEEGNIYFNRQLTNRWYPPVHHRDPDIPDFSGDGTADVAIFRPASGLWAVRRLTRIYFGGENDEPLPGDYDGDGSADFAVFRSSSGLWAVRGVTRIYFGSASDLAAPADYGGDGTRDIAVFRPASGLWAVRGVTRLYFGTSGDSPVPGDYSGDGSKNIGLYRESSGLWAIRRVSRSYFGGVDDAVVPGDYQGEGTWHPGIFRPASGLWAIRGTTRTYFGTGSDQPVPGIYRGDGTDSIGIFRANSGLWALKNFSRVYFGTTGDLPLSR